MRYGVFSDVHSNLEAMTAVLAALQHDAVDEYIFLGDIVGYGADPVACLALLKKLMSEKTCYCLAGNHDHAVCGLSDAVGFNAYAREAVRWTNEQLSDSDLKLLREMPLTAAQDNWVAVHGSLHDPEQWHYIVDQNNALPHLERQMVQVSFVGHSHHPWIIAKKEKIEWSVKTEENLEDGVKYIVNDGSAGQPRDGDPRASYVLYDSSAKRVEIKRVSYDVERAQKKILDAGLPPILAKRLSLGT